MRIVEQSLRLVDPLGLVIFRICFGLFMAWEMLYLIRLDFVEIYLLKPGIVFGYDFLPLPLLPAPLLKLLPLLLLAAALMLALGAFQKWSALAFAIGFGYLFFLDKSIYNNHLYLSILLAAFFAIVPADQMWALKPSKTPQPAQVWHYRLFQFQLVVVFFFGGIAKLNADWLLHWQPVMEILDQSSFLANLLGMKAAAALLVYGGLVFDLSIGFLLWWRKSVWLGLALSIAFNLTNSFLFNDINIFPFMMMCSLVLFIPSEKMRGWMRLKAWTAPKYQQIPMQAALKYGLTAFVVFQLLFPLRHWLISGNADWTMEGQRFSWRMKVQHRSTEEIAFSLLDHGTKTIYPIDFGNYFIHQDQVRLMASDPACLVDFAHYLQSFHQPKLHSPKVEVKARVKVGFNGHPPQFVVNPDLDLASQKRSKTGGNDWIFPLAN
jgi:hypothetical protein